ncbi:hypothetical protein EVAR_66492_1 [Eumeta japonica]|uniref:Uncharacterized protein n=1 Tax=Eumeta variegata TaxID=151549 RepID=A0A4C2AHI5_EUMVA|nr:hypothetical protein EVAR_66492_1 [Eumeta japonica]
MNLYYINAASGLTRSATPHYTSNIAMLDRRRWGLEQKNPQRRLFSPAQIPKSLVSDFASPPHQSTFSKATAINRRVSFRMLYSRRFRLAADSASKAATLEGNSLRGSREHFDTCVIPD